MGEALSSQLSALRGGEGEGKGKEIGVGLGNAPSRSSVGGWVVASINVEGLPPGVRPPSMITSSSSLNRSSNSLGSLNGESPDRFALVPVRGPTEFSKK